MSYYFTCIHGIFQHGTRAGLGKGSSPGSEYPPPTPRSNLKPLHYILYTYYILFNNDIITCLAYAVALFMCICMAISLVFGLNLNKRKFSSIADSDKESSPCNRCKGGKNLQENNSPLYTGLWRILYKTEPLNELVIRDTTWWRVLDHR